MKTISFLFVAALCAIVSQLSAQNQLTTLPAVTLKTMDGKTISTADLKNDGKPMIIDFWATWCKPCIAELNEIQNEWEEKWKPTGVKIIAVSIDDARNSTKVAPFVKGKGWPYLVLLDENSEFKRAMNVNVVPHTFLVDGTGKIVWQHNSYVPGSEDELLENVKNVIAGKPLNK